MNNSLFIKNIYKTNPLPCTYRMISKSHIHVHLHVRAFQKKKKKWIEFELRAIAFFNKPSDLCHSFNHVRVSCVLLSFHRWASHSYHMFFGATLLKLEYFCIFYFIFFLFKQSNCISVPGN